MAVRLDVNARVTGARQVDALNRSVQNLGRGAGVAATRFGGLEAAAARGRASFAALSTTLNVGLVAGLAGLGFAFTRFIRDTFEAGNLVDSLSIRFRLLFGSVGEGARAFDVLNEFAARVPFSLEEIAAASGNLAVISEDAEALSRNLVITGNVAAATGLNFQITAEQIQRSFAGGIASADIFRERGVRAMLGFQAGATVSVEETAEALERVFGEGGRFGNATELLANTLTGQVSLVQDAYFQFRRTVSEQFFDQLTGQIRNLVGDFQSNSERLNAIATRVGMSIGNALVSIENGLRFIVREWENINRVIQAFIAFRVVGVIGGMVAAVASLTLGLTSAGGAAVGLNAALRANPIGALITVVQLAGAAIFTFRDEIASFLQPAIERMNTILSTLGDSFINIINVGRRISGLEPFTTFTQDAEAAAEAVRIAAEETAQFRVQAERANQREAELDEASAELVQIRNAAMAATQARQAELRGLIDTNRRRLATNRLTGELSRMQAEILMIQNEILNHELMTGEAVERTAEQIFAQRNAVQEVNTLEEDRNRILTDRADIIRSNFQNTVRMAEAQAGLDNRERGSLEGRNPQLSEEQIQEAIDRIMRIDNAWMVVQETVEGIGETVGSDLVDAIIDGEDAMEALRGTARNVLSDIARQLASSGLSQLFGGAVRSVRGGGGGGFLSGIAGTIGGFLGFQQGGVVPGGPPFTDRIPALLTPGERVIPRDEVNSGVGMQSNITNININGNVDQRSIDQIREVIATSPAQVGGANNQNTRNTMGLRSRRT